MIPLFYLLSYNPPCNTLNTLTKQWAKFCSDTYPVILSYSIVYSYKNGDPLIHVSESQNIVRQYMSIAAVFPINWSIVKELVHCIVCCLDRRF